MVLQEMMQSLMTGVVPCFETLLKIEATLRPFKKSRFL
jgi:hypothetical protein